MRLGLIVAIGCTLAWMTALAPAASPPDPSLDDARLFSLIDLDHPQLATVKAAAAQKDWTTARRLFVQHLKTRTHPRWFFDWTDRPRDRPAMAAMAHEFNKSRADAFAKNRLVSCGMWHDFGDALDWNFDLSNGHYKEWTWQLNRHPFWQEMGRAYWATGDETYARAFVRQMNQWVATQPRPAKATYGPRTAWRTIEVGLRLSTSWPDAFHYFLSSPSFDDESILRMVQSFHDQAEHLMAHTASANWLTMESNGLFCAGVLFPEYRRSQLWRQTAIDRLYTELDRQVYPDGAQFELTSGYHVVALQNMEAPLKLAALNGITLPADYLAKLQRMFDYALLISMPSRCMPPVNDSSAKEIRPLMRQAASYYPDRPEYQWIASGGRTGKPPQKVSVDFPFAGYYVMRSGWDAEARYLMLDAGPFGYSHQHEDKLNLIVAAYGREHLIDPGNYRYDDSPWRKYFIDTFAHNTIVVDGLPQRRRGQNRAHYVVTEPQPHEWKTTPAYDYASGIYDEGYGTLTNRIATHRRQVLFIKADDTIPASADYWIVVDTLTPADSQPHTYDAMFHLNADAIDIDPQTLRTLTRNPEGANFSIIPVPQPSLSVTNQAGQEKPFLQGWWRKAGAVNGVGPLPTPVYRLQATGPAQIILILYPLQPGQTLPVTNVRKTSNDRNRITISVDLGPHRTDYVELTGNPQDPVKITRQSAAAP